MRERVIKDDNNTTFYFSYFVLIFFFYVSTLCLTVWMAFSLFFAYPCLIVVTRLSRPNEVGSRHPHERTVRVLGRRCGC